MKRMCLPTFALVVFSLYATGQVSADGSIVMAVWEQDDIVFGADGREVYGPTYTDVDCKILTFGDKYIFASAGRSSARSKSKNVSLFNSFAIAKKEYARLTRKGTPDHLSVKLANAWSEAAKQKLEPIKPFITTDLGGPNVVFGLLANFERDGTLEVVKAVISYRNERGDITLTSSVHPIDTKRVNSEILGHAEIAFEYEAGKTPRSILWQKQMTQTLRATTEKTAAFVITIIDLTAKYLAKTRITANGEPFSTVGGEVAAVKLTRSQGVRWIAPGYCHPNN